MKALKILQKTVVALLIILFLLIAIPTIYTFFAKIVTNKLKPTFFGYASAVVVSGSMSGTIEINDYVITKTQSEYQVDDIVMFVGQSGKSLITHRIVEITEDGVKTKGDANNAVDSDITQTDKIVGKVVKVIPNIGGLFAFITSPWGILCVFVVGSLVIEGPYIIKKLIQDKDNFNNTIEKSNVDINNKKEKHTKATNNKSTKESE